MNYTYAEYHTNPCICPAESLVRLQMKATCPHSSLTCVLAQTQAILRPPPYCMRLRTMLPSPGGGGRATPAPDAGGEGSQHFIAKNAYHGRPATSTTTAAAGGLVMVNVTPSVRRRCAGPRPNTTTATLLQVEVLHGVLQLFHPVSSGSAAGAGSGADPLAGAMEHAGAAACCCFGAAAEWSSSFRPAGCQTGRCGPGRRNGGHLYKICERKRMTDREVMAGRKTKK